MSGRLTIGSTGIIHITNNSIYKNHQSDVLGSDLSIANVKLQAQELASDLRIAKGSAMAEGSASIDFTDIGPYINQGFFRRNKKRTGPFTR